mmetsp:Transcript_32154/g.51956  ORF Transcript_32154/g.51956 Transcript_32154/m.51956 type:complete len:170 (-) Transcript_32154:1045-1554(-)
MEPQALFDQLVGSSCKLTAYSAARRLASMFTQQESTRQLHLVVEQLVVKLFGLEFPEEEKVFALEAFKILRSICKEGRRRSRESSASVKTKGGQGPKVETSIHEGNLAKRRRLLSKDTLSSPGGVTSHPLSKGSDADTYIPLVQCYNSTFTNLGWLFQRFCSSNWPVSV